MEDSSSSQRFDPLTGARNLLLNCVGAKGGDRVTILAEDPSHGFYDMFAAQCITEAARDIGCSAQTIPCPLISGPEELPEKVSAAMKETDHVIFQARAGDQVRFTPLSGRATKTISYAIDIGFLGSGYSTLHHGLMQEVLDCFENELDTARTWRITCPLGTDVTGTQHTREKADDAGDSFSLDLFPIPIFRPVLCGTMSGKVAVAHWLMATQNRAYEEDHLILDEPVIAAVESGRIVDLEGSADVVKSFRNHYRRVSGLFDIDADVVHSWHTGIHPAAFYPLPAVTDINRWGAIAFANPRYTHFHTCGDYAPGEIAWSVFDATIELDGTVYWQEGRFVFLDRPEIEGLLPKYGYDSTVFQQRDDIGI